MKTCPHKIATQATSSNVNSYSSD